MGFGLRAGVAKVDITPPVGLAMAGYGARERPSEGVLDPLSAYAIALEQGDTACGLVVADLIGFPAEVTAQIRKEVEDRCGLVPGHLFVCATHTHWGPEIRSRLIPDGLAKTGSAEYTAVLGHLAASALVQAWNEREPAIALCGTGEADLLSFNRRPVGPDGKAVMSWRMPLGKAMAASRAGARLAETWAPGGPRGQRLSDPLAELDGLRAGVSDPSVPLLKLVRPDGSPLAALFSFACHPVCGAGDETFYLYSADYPAYARRLIETVLGCPAVFVAGCCGDQVPLRREDDARKRIGHSLGAEVIRVWELIEGEGLGPLRVAGRKVSLPAGHLPGVAEAEAALAQRRAAREGASAERYMLWLAETYGGRQTIEAEVWSMALGNAWGLVGLPGEVLGEIGLQIKQGSPFGTTAVVELGLDDPGYVPTDAAIAEGGYEPLSSPFGKGTEAALVAASRAALGDVA
jgi:neutral ceramidase